jgi:excisionase family DNA binding protein
MERLHTPEEAAKILQVSEKTVRTWLKSRKLRGVLAGRFWRIRESDLEAFLREPDEATKPTGKPASPAKVKRQR